MAGFQRIDDERSAAALAELLNGDSRTKPVVVVTIPAGRAEPWIDAGAIADEAGSLAEVYLMPTRDISWEFSRLMAEGTQVFGGAGRVYPVGHEWASDLTRSPLRFAWNEADGRRATQALISDALRMAAAAGLLRSLPTQTLRQVEGVVTGLVAGRGLVRIGNAMPAAIAEELTVEDVPIARLLTVGQRVSGWYDPETHRVDVTASLRGAADALAAYAVGDVVLARVATMRADAAELVLYPRIATPQTTTPAVTVAIDVADVTTNPLDDLRLLMTVGEVVGARVTATGPHWALALNDVDDDEPIRTAPALLAGGPPWLVEDVDALAGPEAEEPAPVLPPAPAPAPALPQPPATPGPAAERVTPEPPAAAVRRPTPAMFDRRRPRPGSPDPSSLRPAPARPEPPRAAPPRPGPPRPGPGRPGPPAAAPQSEGTRTLLQKIDGLTADLHRREREQDRLTAQVRAAADEREQLRYLLDQAERRANRAEHELKAARSRLRKAAKTPAPSEAGSGPLFADPEQGFRHLVLTRWAIRTPLSQQPDRPLPEYILGPCFLESLDALDGIRPEKVADVVVEIVTGMAPQIAARRVHPLRTGPGPSEPARSRTDGAKAWRASLQVNTPSARRIHYWTLPGGQIELSRVDTHDDYDI